MSNTYLLVDNLSPIYLLPSLKITSPLSNTTASCQVLLSGRWYDSIPQSIQIESKQLGMQSAVVNPDSTWSLSLTYPKGYTGKDTIIANAYYPFSASYKSIDTLIYNIVCPQDTLILPPAKPTVFLPNLITKNNDGKNDVLALKIQAIEDTFVVQIYNRWSSLIFYSEDYSDNWPQDNTPAGIYYYRIIFREEEHNGWLEVLGGK